DRAMRAGSGARRGCRPRPPRARPPGPRPIRQRRPRSNPRPAARRVVATANGGPSGSRLLRAPIEKVDRLDEPPPGRVLEVEELFERPVEVIGHVRDLVEEPITRVRHDSPGPPPARSIVKSCLQDGQVTA